MTQWNFGKRLGAIVVSSMAVAGFAVAGPCDDCCDPCANFCEGFDVGIDLIVWEPCLNDLDYAATYDSAVAATTASNGKRHAIDHDWEPGFRIRLAKNDVWCGLDFSFSYTYLTADKKNGVSGASAGLAQSVLTHPLQTFAGVRAAARSNLCYQTFDILFSFDCCCDPCHVIRPFFGIEGLFVDHKIHARVDNGTDVERVERRWKGDVSAVGLKVGSEYRFRYDDCLSLFARASGTLATGDIKTTDRNTAVSGSTLPGPSELNYHDKSCVCFPGWHIQLGAEYETCYCGHMLNARLGYEFVQWTNFTAPRRYFGSSALSAANGTSEAGSNLAFHGIFVGGGVSF